MRLAGRQNHRGCTIRGRGRGRERESGRGMSKDRSLRVSQLGGHADGDGDRDRRGRGRGREGDGDRERQREKEREEWGSQRHCCRSLIFFDPISVFFSASHSRSITRTLTHSLTTDSCREEMEGSGRCFHVLPNTTSASFVLRKHYSTLLCLYEQADADGNGTDYDEFITATMHLNWIDKHLYITFQHFDKRRDVVLI